MSYKPDIRIATLRDLKALTSLETEAFLTDRFKEDQIEYLITRAHATILIMEVDGQVAGSASSTVDTGSSPESSAAPSASPCPLTSPRHQSSYQDRVAIR